ncbi:MAG: CoA transferase [Burkholderiaceae bacterium]
MQADNTQGPDNPTVPPAASLLRDLWRLGGMEEAALPYAALSGSEPALPSSFAIGTAAQVTIAAAVLAAAELRHRRGQARQTVAVKMRHAAQECSSWFSLNAVVPPVWDKFSGLYACGPGGRGGWVRIHANFQHHREGVLRLLGCPASETARRADVEAALQSWQAVDFEEAAAQAGLVVAAVRSFEEWDAHAQGKAVAALPLFSMERMSDAPPRMLAPLAMQDRPLQGVRVLDLTRVLAGPVAGRTLAAYGADVMLVNAPHLPNIESIAETSRGKLSALIDLQTGAGRASLEQLVRGCNVFVQGYRPGALASHGFGPQDTARMCPGIVHVSLSAYGHVGPWSGRRGFDSLTQTSTGFNLAEAAAAQSNQPKTLPVQILDHASGFLMAFAAQAALMRQLREGGSWHVRVSLAQTAQWLRAMGRLPEGLRIAMPSLDEQKEASDSGFGQLVAIRHAARLSDTPAYWSRPSMPPGSHPPVWP